MCGLRGKSQLVMWTAPPDFLWDSYISWQMPCSQNLARANPGSKNVLAKISAKSDNTQFLYLLYFDWINLKSHVIIYRLKLKVCVFHCVRKNKSIQFGYHDKKKEYSQTLHCLHPKSHTKQSNNCLARINLTFPFEGASYPTLSCCWEHYPKSNIG